ncbi:hypothetical protein K438DRAFT_1748761 [Mycena galopus ATCC 62051]|nr:hypothetical protein K438DRAFT_1748761 [Mycena galopus ATCC 62051]
MATQEKTGRCRVLVPFLKAERLLHSSWNQSGAKLKDVVAQTAGIRVYFSRWLSLARPVGGHNEDPGVSNTSSAQHAAEWASRRTARRRTTSATWSSLQSFHRKMPGRPRAPMSRVWAPPARHLSGSELRDGELIVIILKSRPHTQVNFFKNQDHSDPDHCLVVMEAETMFLQQTRMSRHIRSESWFRERRVRPWHRKNMGSSNSHVPKTRIFRPHEGISVTSKSPQYGYSISKVFHLRTA